MHRLRPESPVISLSTDTMDVCSPPQPTRSIQVPASALVAAANKRAAEESANSKSKPSAINVPGRGTMGGSPGSSGSTSPNTTASPGATGGTNPNGTTNLDLSSVLSLNSVSAFPALRRSGRYRLLETLQQSLFGAVKLGVDTRTGCEVAIKISARQLATHGRARSGAKVLENVKREANVMRFMHQFKAKQLTQQQPGKKSQKLGQNKKKSGVSLVDTDSDTDATDSGMDTDGADSDIGSPDALNRRLAHLNTKSASGTASASIESTDTDSSDVDKEIEISGTPSSPQQAVTTLASKLPDEDEDGSSYICGLVEEIEDEWFHYLITEFASGGDLHSLLLSLPAHRLPEPQAKYLFRQLAMGIKYLHDNHVAHLDLSLENVCVSAQGQVKIIDFGVAVIHPLAPKPQQITAGAEGGPKNSLTATAAAGHGAKMSPGRSSRSIRSTSNVSQYVEGAANDQLNSANSSTSSTPLASPLGNNRSLRIANPSSRATVTSNAESSTVTAEGASVTLPAVPGAAPNPNAPAAQNQQLLNTFLCSPISKPSHQPGKVGYMSPELYSGRMVWDAYANDVFALGVILYCLLTGRPPFVYPHPQDPWFNLIFSGQWIKVLEEVKRTNSEFAAALEQAQLEAANNPTGVVTTKDGAAAETAVANPTTAIANVPNYLHIYSHLSPAALSLLDSLIKPQHKRLTIDAVLSHPWLNLTGANPPAAQQTLPQ